MKKIFFLVDPTGKSVFGAQTSEGQFPAFFTEEDVASAFFAKNITDDDWETHTLAGSDNMKDVLDFLTYNEKSIVILDMVPMTQVEMFKKLQSD